MWGRGTWAAPPAAVGAVGAQLRVLGVQHPRPSGPLRACPGVWGPCGVAMEPLNAGTEVGAGLQPCSQSCGMQTMINPRGSIVPSLHLKPGSIATHSESTPVEMHGCAFKPELMLEVIAACEEVACKYIYLQAVFGNMTKCG